MYNYLLGSLRIASAPLLKESAVFKSLPDVRAVWSCVLDSGAVGLKPASASPGGPVKIQIQLAGLPPRASDSVGQGETQVFAFLPDFQVIRCHKSVDRSLRTTVLKYFSKFKVHVSHLGT